jgi:hypothetical protein
MSTRVSTTEEVLTSFIVSLRASRVVQGMVAFGTTFSTTPDSALFSSIAARVQTTHAYPVIALQDALVFLERRSVTAHWPILDAVEDGKRKLFLPIREDGTPFVRWKSSPVPGGERQWKRLGIALEEIAEALSMRSLPRVRDERVQPFLVYTYTPTDEAM